MGPRHAAEIDWSRDRLETEFFSYVAGLRLYQSTAGRPGHFVS